MIENQFASMPAGKSGSHAAQDRKHQPVWQDGFGPVEPKARIGTDNGEHDHGRNCVVPACHTNTNAGDGQQFECADDRGQDAKDECCASRPLPHIEPELVAGEPVENIDPERRYDECDRKMNQHGMERMTGNRDRRGYVLFGDRPDMGVGVIGIDFLPLFQCHFEFFAVARRIRQKMVPLLKTPALAATPFLLVGCGGELSTLDPAGPRAANLATLWWVMFWGSVALFALVMVLFFLAYFRSAFLARLKPAHWIIGGGLVLPIPVLVLLTGTALVLGEQLLPRGDEPLRIGVTAERWHWRFHYPNGTTSEEQVVHIPAGQPVDFAVTGGDVIHSFWIPRLGGKIDAIPGHTNLIRLEADQPGTYWGQCAEYCGEGHDIMFFRVEAHEPDTFAALMENGQ